MTEYGRDEIVYGYKGRRRNYTWGTVLRTSVLDILWERVTVGLLLWSPVLMLVIIVYAQKHTF